MSAAQDSSEVTLVKGACPHDCPDTCALEVHVKNGVAFKVTGSAAHGPTAGVLCTKVARYTERTYHANRLLHPLRRVGRKGEGRFERIGWKEAVDSIAARLATIAADDPQQILPYSYAGTMGLVQGESMAQRFFHKLGASLLDRTICAAAGSAGHEITLGSRIGMDMELADEAKLIVFWGSNAITSSVHFWARAQQARRRGATLVAIDPYRSLTAEKCQIHIAPLPGTDGALALGLMHVLIRDGLFDEDYVGRHTVGFEELRIRAGEYDPNRVAAICGITAGEIESLARLYGTTRPSLIRANYGLQRARGGGMAMRNIACLPALVGAFREAAGGILLSTSDNVAVDSAALSRPDLLGSRRPRIINMSTIGHALLDENAPIRAMIVYNANPVAVAPDSARVARGFAREDLFTVVLEHFQTDTADYADIVLPATTQLEHVDVVKPYGHYYMVANNPAIEPLGESKPNTEIFRLLSSAMGFTEPCFRDSDEKIAQAAIARDWDFQSVRELGWTRIGPSKDTPRFADGGFDTPSGKVEFRSASAQRMGLDALPDYIAPKEDTRSELARRYPLAMISPPARHFLNSSFVNVESLRATEGEPWLDLHPQDAIARGIEDGRYVRVFNDRGSLELRARVTDRARCGVVVALSVWWKKLARDGKNANELTSSDSLTDMGRAPIFYDCLVEVAPL
ncbi:MAG: anaerobic dehydrogenase, typically selenocysteine-containing oxidoreductase protein [Gammaproteobacteria bacterium]|nr:anaerobic dehydrogenase, typically selenocysteine-containing oxidoreductase protein [Gammaproteobacteria bacterium]